MKLKRLCISFILLGTLGISSHAFADPDSIPAGLTPEMALDMRGYETDADVEEAAAHGQRVRNQRALGINHHARGRINRSGALTGKRIGLSPGHGRKRTDQTKSWAFQRSITNDVLEDKHTYEWMYDYIRPMLERAGAETISARAASYTEYRYAFDFNSSNYTETGSWTANTKGNYKFADANASETATAAWNFNVDKTDYYPVYIKYYSSNNRISDAQVTIKHARGESIVTVDQSLMYVKDGTGSEAATLTQNTATTYQETWHYLGLYPFKAGQTASIKLSNVSSETGKVVIVEAIQIGDGDGTVVNSSNQTSGYYRWQESYYAYSEWAGLPSWVRTNDVSGRSLYSLYEGVDVQFALHSNAGNGKTRGTQMYVWYPTDASGAQQWVRESNWTPNFANTYLPPGTYEFATNVNNNFLDYVINYYDSSWTPSKFLMGCNLGELRPAKTAWYNNKNNNPIIVPTALLEAAYHDNPDDAAILAEQTYRFYGARGIVAGMIKYFNGADAMIPPLPPTKLTVVAEDCKAKISWEPEHDKLIKNSEPTKYNIYISDDGLLFDLEPVLTVTDTSAELPLAYGETLFVRVTAVNDAGESLDSTVGAARMPVAGAKHILYIDGVDREVKTAHDANNDRSYARIYAPAISYNNANLGIDTVDDEAAAKLLQDHKYDLVIWAVGETSTRTNVMPEEQRNIVKSLRNQNTPLLVNGSELAFALAKASYNPDTSFLNDNFGINYVKDASDSYTINVSGLTKSNSLAYSNCIDYGGNVNTKRIDASCIEYPDVISTNTATPIIKYESGDIAAAMTSDNKAIFVAFPLESINDKTERLCLISNLISKLLGTPLNTACTASVYSGSSVCDSNNNPGDGNDNPGSGNDNPGDGNDNPGNGNDNPGSGNETPGDRNDNPDDGNDNPDTENTSNKSSDDDCSAALLSPTAPSAPGFALFALLAGLGLAARRTKKRL